MQAESYIDMGYQRILTFERQGGGFDWWGNGPALIWLSAYGVQQLTATSKVRDIDTGVIKRAAEFLKQRQDSEGSWGVVGDTHSETISRVNNPKLALTSYVAWSLAESGYANDVSVAKAIACLQKNRQAAMGDAYTLSLMANAFVFAAPKDAMTAEILDELDRMKKESGDVAWWECTGQTATCAYGGSANVETTAMVVYAMLHANSHNATATKALQYLVKQKSGSGTWGSTQATILALKALVFSEVTKTQGSKATVEILFNDEKVGMWNIDDDNRDVMQMLDLAAKTKIGNNKIRFVVQGDANVMYQVVTRHYQPWNKVKLPKRNPVEIDLVYDRTRLVKNDTLTATATVRYNAEKPTFMVIVDLGIPPGFIVDPGDFAELVGEGKIKRYAVTSRQITLYLGDVKPNDVLKCTYHMKAKYPIRAKTPKSTVYEYYSPNIKADSKPVELVVTEK